MCYEVPFKIAELWSSISLYTSFPNIYLFIDIYILTKFPKYNMKDETSKLIKKLNLGSKDCWKQVSLDKS